MNMTVAAIEHAIHNRVSPSFTTPRKERKKKAPELNVGFAIHTFIHVRPHIVNPTHTHSTTSATTCHPGFKSSHQNRERPLRLMSAEYSHATMQNESASNMPPIVLAGL